MMRALLADRFRMTMHTEEREFPVYTYDSRRTGRNFNRRLRSLQPRRTRREPPLVNVTAAGGPNGVAVDLGGGSSFAYGNNRFEIRKMTMIAVAEMLTRFVDRAVINQTGLTGTYDIVLNIAPDDYTPLIIRSAINAGVTLPPQALRLLDNANTDRSPRPIAGRRADARVTQGATPSRCRGLHREDTHRELTGLRFAARSGTLQAECHSSPRTSRTVSAIAKTSSAPLKRQSFAAHIAGVEFSNFEMRGVVAKRRVAFFGGVGDDRGDAPAPPIPDFLRPLIDRAAAWAGVAPDAFAMALINEYREGAPIGWHRDAPQYDIVAGISLISPSRMRFRPYVSPGGLDVTAGRRKTTHEIVLHPRSAYLMTGEARNSYEHSIPPVAALRYSITFRTLRQGRALRLSRTGG